MPRDYKFFLDDILESIIKIEGYKKGISFSHLTENQLILDAILYNLQVIGEAAKHIPEDVRNKYTDVEWRKIAGLRDIVAHEYFGISLEIIWDVLENKLPALSSAIKKILMENGKQ
jgi:uncharacterized protein with HEPN domain